jgi:hypothetical protein
VSYFNNQVGSGSKREDLDGQLDGLTPGDTTIDSEGLSLSTGESE